jgi:hypothetical protein
MMVAMRAATERFCYSQAGVEIRSSVDNNKENFLFDFFKYLSDI